MSIEVITKKRVWIKTIRGSVVLLLGCFSFASSACNDLSDRQIVRDSALSNEPNVELSQAQNRNSPAATNSKGTLFGENMGDSILYQFAINDRATEYFVYSSNSLTGPWKTTGRFSQGAATTGAAKIHRTSDARLMDVCLKVEAVDATGVVIETYEPICVPKFVP